MSELYAHVHKLWLFSLIAEHRSMRRAAVQAKLSVSALSQHLAALEKVIGVALVVRSPAALGLTPRGETLLAEVKPILEKLDAISSSARARRPAATVLRLGAYESVALSYLPKSLSALTARDEDLTITLRMGRVSALETFVREGELDMAILDLPAQGGLDCLPLAASRLGLYRSARHPEALDAGGTLRLGTLSYARGGQPAYFRRFLDRAEEALRARGTSMRVVVESDSFEALRAAACEGDIAVVLPEHVAMRTHGVLREIDSGDVPAECQGHHVLHLVSGKRVNPRLRDAIAQQLVVGSSDGCA